MDADDTARNRNTRSRREGEISPYALAINSSYHKDNIQYLSSFSQEYDNRHFYNYIVPKANTNIDTTLYLIYNNVCY